MLITSSKEATTEFAAELIKRNIPCYTEGNIDFKITSYLEAVLNLFIYIASKKEDKIAYLELLSSPIFGFDITNSVDMNEDYISQLGLNFDSLDVWPSNVLESIAASNVIAKSQDIFGFEVVNNYDWLKEFSYIDWLRDVGKFFNVGYMLNKDIVRRRLDEGITYTEFSYMTMQAYDFLHSYENKNCVMQVAGQDQWGNITAGIELIRKKIGKEAYGFTMPLLTKSDGSNCGLEKG